MYGIVPPVDDFIEVVKDWFSKNPCISFFSDCPFTFLPVRKHEHHITGFENSEVKVHVLLVGYTYEAFCVEMRRKAAEPKMPQNQRVSSSKLYVFVNLLFCFVCNLPRNIHRCHFSPPYRELV